MDAVEYVKPSGSTTPRIDDRPPYDAVSRVTEYLKLLLISGRLEGRELNEQEVAAQLAVSRTPVREAVARLTGEGLLVKRGRKSITPFRPTLDDLRGIYDLRRLLEPHAIGIAAHNCADDYLNGELKQRLSDLQSAQPGSDWAVKHEEYHLSIVRAAGNPRLTTLVQQLRILSEPYVRFVVTLTDSFRAKAAEDHEKLCEFLIARDARGSERLIEHHLSKTLKEAVAQLEGKDGSLGLDLRTPIPR